MKKRVLLLGMSVQPGGANWWSKFACGMDPCEQLRAAEALLDAYRQSQAAYGTAHANAVLYATTGMSPDNLKDLIWELKRICGITS